MKTLCPACDSTGLVSPIMDETDLGQAPGSARHVCSLCMPPRFGQVIRNSFASSLNPQRDGYFVEHIHRRGRVNKGHWWRCTDGEGRFWEIPAVEA